MAMERKAQHVDGRDVALDPSPLSRVLFHQEVNSEPALQLFRSEVIQLIVDNEQALSALCYKQSRIWMFGSPTITKLNQKKV